MNTIEEYLESVDEIRREDFNQLYQVIKDNIPKGFEACIQYGMIGFTVPLLSYPTGYLGRVDEPLPFIHIAAQKNHIALYHLGIMANDDLLAWFQAEYMKRMPTKLNMGKSCIRFTNAKKIPYELIGELVQKISVKEWVLLYEKEKKM